MIEWDGEEFRSDEDEVRVVIFRCRFFIFFCSFARTVSSFLRVWWMGICGYI